MSQFDSTRYAPVWKRRRWLPSVLWAGAGLGAAAGISSGQPIAPPVVVTEYQRVAAQQPAPAPAEKGDTKAAQQPAKAEPEKTVSVNFEGAPWQEVLDWYAKETGLIMVTTVRPTGSVTIKPGPNRKFTLSEVTDLLNEAMIPQKFLLIRYQTSFTVWPADEKIDPTRLPRIDASELPRRGKTEIVLCNIGPFKAVSAPDVMPEVEKMLTPFGRAILLTQANSIQVMDTAGNIVRIQRTLDDEKAGGQSESINHVCKWRRAAEMAAVLERLLKDDQTRIEGTGAAAPGFGGPGGYPYPGGGNPYYPQPGGGDPRRGDGRDPRSTYPAAGGRTKTVQIVVDSRRNAVLVTAPPEKIALAQDIIRDFDKQTEPGQKEITPSAPELRTYTVQPGTADAVAKIIQEKNPAIRVTAIPTSNQLLVYGTPEEQTEVVAQIRGGNSADGAAGATTTKFIALQNLNPGDTAATLGKLFPATTSGGPVLDPQTGINPGILFRGTQAQLDEVERALRALDPTIGGDGSGRPTGRSLSITLDNGNAGILAEVLSNAMQQMNKNPVQIRNLNGPAPATLPPTAPRPAPAPSPAPGMTQPMPAPTGAPTMPPPAPLPGTRRSQLPAGPLDPRFVLAQMAEPAKGELKPITITVVGNRLTIESDDPAALQLINEMVRLYTSQAKPDENLFQVIRLKYVGAAEAAKVVTEIFNGPQQQQGGPGGRGGGGPGGLLGGLLGGGGGGPGGLLGGLLGGGGAAPAGGPSPNRIRVVAEPTSNSLIVVKATPLDLLTIRKLLANVIDSGETDSEAIQRTFVIPLKNTEAGEMASVIQSVFRTAINPQQGNRGQANPLLPFLPPQGGGNQQQQQAPALSVGVDDRTNSIVVLCSETLYREVKALVDQLDTAPATNGAEVVQVVPIKGLDPDIVRQVIEAVGGTPPAGRGTGLGGMARQGGAAGGGFPGGGGGGGFPGFGGGGGGFPGFGGGGGFPGFGGGGGLGGGRGGGGGFPGMGGWGG